VSPDEQILVLERQLKGLERELRRLIAGGEEFLGTVLDKVTKTGDINLFDQYLGLARDALNDGSAPPQSPP
jgi:hypothetical protein